MNRILIWAWIVLAAGFYLRNHDATSALVCIAISAIFATRNEQP